MSKYFGIRVLSVGGNKWSLLVIICLQNLTPQCLWTAVSSEYPPSVSRVTFSTLSLHEVWYNRPYRAEYDTAHSVYSLWEIDQVLEVFT